MHLIYGASALLATLQVVCASFGYSRHDQHEWGKEYELCDGKWQSPIALYSSRSVPLPLPSVEAIGYHNLLPRPINITNNGHSVALSFYKAPGGDRFPYVFGGLLNKNQDYELEGIHFHWGSKNNRGSEHVLNGIRFPMEMHIIHRNMKYATVDEASAYEDGLTVLGVFFQLQEEDNEKFAPILNTFPDVKWVGSIVQMNESFTLSAVMPDDTDIFYTYRGSLTTPPCNQAVTWIVFANPVHISPKQMDGFRKLSNGAAPLVDNFRQLQYPGNRKVYMRKMERRFASSNDMINLDLEKLKWNWQ